MNGIQNEDWYDQSSTNISKKLDVISDGSAAVDHFHSEVHFSRRLVAVDGFP